MGTRRRAQDCNPSSSPGRVTTTRLGLLTLTSLDAFALLNFTEDAKIFYGGCIY